MKVRFYSPDDEWSADDVKITAPETLEIIRKTLDTDGPVIVEHWFYRGACAPDRMVFDDFEEFVGYLNTHANAGDAIHVWNFSAVCTNDNELAHGKCPDEHGRVPFRGAY